jgi:hypothetical protein
MKATELQATLALLQATQARMRKLKSWAKHR